jgi:acyl-coenzyme A thioesterase PaaI-like protein
VLKGPGVTVSFACEFLDAAREGELVEGSCEVMRAGGSMIFLRGLLNSGERTLFTFSGTIKRVKRRALPAAGNDPT